MEREKSMNDKSKNGMETKRKNQKKKKKSK